MRSALRPARPPFAFENAQSALDKFLTLADWDEYDLNRRRVELELARLHRRPVSSRAGRLLIADTMAHHTKCKIEELAYLKDHKLNRYIWAHNVVTSYYLTRADQFPVDFSLYLQFREKKWGEMLAELVAQLQAEPDLDGYRRYLVSLLAYRRRQCEFRTKTQMAADFVRQAVDWGLPFDTVLSIAGNRLPLVDVIQDKKKDWVGGCPKDCKVLPMKNLQATAGAHGCFL